MLINYTFNNVHVQGSRQQYIEELFGLIRLSIIPVADLIERVSNEDVINTNSKFVFHLIYTYSIYIYPSRNFYKFTIE